MTTNFVSVKPTKVFALLLGVVKSHADQIWSAFAHEIRAFEVVSATVVLRAFFFFIKVRGHSIFSEFFVK